MNSTSPGALIRALRKEKGLTQKALADILNVSDKAISKWECQNGSPDISLLPALSEIFGVNIDKLIDGTLVPNIDIGGNMKKSKYYICPTCKSIAVCTGNTQVSCCDRKLPSLVPKKPDALHQLNIEEVEDDWYITSAHPMTKEHYISFAAFSTGDEIKIIKSYPEWNLQIRLPRRRHGTLLWFCGNDGLYYKHL